MDGRQTESTRRDGRWKWSTWADEHMIATRGSWTCCWGAVGGLMTPILEVSTITAWPCRNPWIHAHGHVDIWLEHVIWWYDLLACTVYHCIMYYRYTSHFTAILVKCIHGLCYVYQQYIHLIRNFQTLVSQRAGLSFPFAHSFTGDLSYCIWLNQYLAKQCVYKIPTNRHNLLGTNHLQHQISTHPPCNAARALTERTQSHLAMQPAKR